jgi:FkbM family methyltransferase
MIRLFRFCQMAWRIWRAHGTIVFIRLLWYYLKAALTGEWETWLWDLIPTAGRIAIDGGANKGQWTLKLAERFCQVVAFEPHPISASQLKAGALRNVSVVQAALWNVPETRPLIAYPDLRICRIVEHDFLYSMGQGRNGSSVSCLPLDTFRLQQVDFIKLDVEGAEAEALEGAVETINASHPVLLVEIHSVKAKERIERLLILLDYTWEYRHFPIYRPKDELYEKRLWLVARKR